MELQELIKKYLPEPIKRNIKKVYRYITSSVFDIWNTITGNKDILMPPRRINYEGGAKWYRESGDKYLKYFIDLCNLKPNHYILEVGSGMGRIARAIAQFLEQSGHYDGIDIVKTGVEWCTRVITKNYPNAKFQQINLYNKHYNPKGTYKAVDFQFSFEDERYDFVVLISVFTHMLLDEVEHYLAEIARVLKKGGCCYITYFLINSESLESIKKNELNFKFKCKDNEYYTTDIKVPTKAVAYNENMIRFLYKKNNFIIKEPVYYGRWCGRENTLDLQDIIVARKK